MSSSRVAPLSIAPFKKILCNAGMLLLATCALPMAAQANAPEITPSLQKMLGGLPIAGIKDQVQGMVGALQKTSCSGNLTGCYSAQSGPLQLYFFTSGQAQQTLLLVVDKKLTMPRLLGDKVQKVMGDTALSSPIISLSTTDYALDIIRMPPALQKVIRDSYFNVSSLAFSSGVQLAARADLGGAIKLAMEAFGVRGNELTMRAAIVMPIPTDLAGAAGAGAGAAEAVSHGNTIKKAGADAMKPEAFVEFQFAPNAKLPLKMPAMNLTDATFFLNNALTFGYKGNAAYKGVSDKKILVHFQTLLDPAGVMDLADFTFRMATPANFTMEDAAHVMVAMATPDVRLAKYGGGFISNIESYKNALLTATKPLSVLQFRNPNPAPEYRFGDSSKPFPEDGKYFNISLLGPAVKDGPYMRLAGEANILGQKMGWLDASAGLDGLQGTAGEAINLKLGPLGRVKIKMAAQANVDPKSQNISLKGNFVGQVVNVILNGSTLTIDVPASCANPFEIKTSVAIQASTNIADVFEGQGGANVDPSKISGCIGKELEAAYNKIAGEYKNLSGYTASAANAELKKIGNAAADASAAAAAEAKKQEEAARKQYEKTKNAARNVANQSSNAANSALKAADNVFKGFGKKKRHKKGPDPRFAASVFDWDYYYDNRQDVVKRGIDLSTHWRDTGFQYGGRGSPEFDVKYYRARYLDVQKLCTVADYNCALQHWLDYGIEQGRQGSPDFSVASYVNRYSDLRRRYGTSDYIGAFEHWFENGEEAGRNGRPDSASPGPIAGTLHIGGGGGGAWSDDAVCAGQYVIGWRIAAGRTVDRVQFLYPDGWAPVQGGSADFTSRIALAAGEYIVQVNYRSGGSVDSLSFKTSKGRTFGPYGGDGGSPGTYNVTPGEKLGCVKGRSGKSTDQLVFSSTGPR
ncbi:jacalin-like lectin [Herminiimonas aquatilis]|uniref:Jacalin-like lectin n=1 Tax=Herminiimonas aquatilis TaxID=345342 RepID=A0ABW2J396_9BURK